MRGLADSAARARAFPEILRADAQRAIEFAGRVFPRNDHRQLHQSIFRMKAAKAREKLFSHVAPRNGHSIRVFQSRTLLISVERADSIIGKGQNLFVC